MSKMYYGSIDLKKLDKSKIVKHDKNGNLFENGANYYPIVVWINDEIDQYGNIASVQSGMTKEERESGQKATYIGNLKNPQGQNSNAPAPSAAPVQNEAVEDFNEDDLPF